MIGLTENLNVVLNNSDMLLNELKELLTQFKLSVIDVFEIIHSLINNNELTDKEALKVIDELIDVGLLNEDDLINF
jgi:predicted DNA binding protein